MADLIYLLLIVLVPIWKGDIFWPCPLKHKQKQWLLFFENEKVQGVQQGYKTDGGKDL